MNLGLDYLTDNYYMNQIYQQKKTAEQNSSVGFNGVLSTKAAENVDRTGQSLKDMWQSRFPGAYYHVMDGSKISQGVWDRNDFPFERFFSDNVNESILNWRPSGAEPAANSPEVQSRWSSTAGQKAIIVPPALEEKMKNDPELAKKVMADVENFIDTYPAYPGCSYLIELDKNGEISKFRVTGPMRITVSSSTFADARRAREAKHAEYERIAEENAQKRKLYEQIAEENAIKRESLEQERIEKEYQSAVTQEAILKYEATFL